LHLREAVLDGECDQLGRALEVQLAQDVASVGLHGPRRQVQADADFLVA
jgi:hypothetical protein